MPLVLEPAVLVKLMINQIMINNKMKVTYKKEMHNKC